MGYYIFSYGIDAKKIRQSIGSADKTLYNGVIETDIFDMYTKHDIEGYIATEEALEQLIFGRRNSLFSRYHKTSAHAYWYAFIAICAYLGECLRR